MRRWLPVLLPCSKSLRKVRHRSRDFDDNTVGAHALHVRFSDLAAEPISRVTFALDDGATTVNDVGTFSPGITIDHNLRLASAAATSCAVSAVTFADGATWDAK